MTPEHQDRQSALVAEVAGHFGRLSDEGLMELAMVSNELTWALDRLRDHYLQMQSDDLE